MSIDKKNLGRGQALHGTGESRKRGEAERDGR
jgi:hypothetical protein